VIYQASWIYDINTTSLDEPICL